MDEADKNVSTFYKHLTNHSGLFHISSWALISGILEKNKTRRWIHHVKKIK